MLLRFPNYKMFTYEQELAKMEIDAFFPNKSYDVSASGIDIALDCVNASIKESLSKLTYIESFDCDGVSIPTYQSLKEASCPRIGTHKKQSTRYGAHGLHEYKGKFNPQIVSSIINICGLSDKDRILEPFCGSGTTLYESILNGIPSDGFDYNPLACFLSNAKLATLKITGNDLTQASDIVLEKCDIQYKSIVIENTDRSEYLSKWLEPNYLNFFEYLLLLANDLIKDENVRTVFLSVCSNNLRDYSLQEPADLRIRRRSSPYPEISVSTKIRAAICELALSIDTVKNIYKFSQKDIKSCSHNIDIRNTEALRSYGNYSAAITSPPYATALPYIDTQRLSLIWLGLASPKRVKELENNLIGSRELTKREENLLRNELELNSKGINNELLKLCLEMLSALKDTDGFRRQAMPFIVYRYFCDMKLMFENVCSMLKMDGLYALVVGHNQTTLGGKLFDLDTPTYLKMIAEESGFKTIEDIKLDVYKRYDLHKANSINSERLIILKKVK